MLLLFDLDGTLTDSSPGIIRCINHALRELGHQAVPDHRVLGLIGTPLAEIFGTLLDSGDVVVLDAAVAAYRRRFNDVGIFENALFPGIIDALHGFRRSGHALQIVTAKPAVAARRVIEHFDIARFFDAVHGPDLGARTCQKADLVGAALNRMGPRTGLAMMIGDRAEDVLAARAHDIPGIGVGWGYGSRQDLDAAGPAFVAESVAELVEWVESAGTEQ